MACPLFLRIQFYRQYHTILYTVHLTIQRAAESCRKGAKAREAAKKVAKESIKSRLEKAIFPFGRQFYSPLQLFLFRLGLPLFLLGRYIVLHEEFFGTASSLSAALGFPFAVYIFPVVFSLLLLVPLLALVLALVLGRLSFGHLLYKLALPLLLLESLLFFSTLLQSSLTLETGPLLETGALFEENPSVALPLTQLLILFLLLIDLLAPSANLLSPNFSLHSDSNFSKFPDPDVAPDVIVETPTDSFAGRSVGNYPSPWLLFGSRFLLALCPLFWLPLLEQPPITLLAAQALLLLFSFEAALLPPTPLPFGGRAIVFYDGLCALCNYSVRWLRNEDRLQLFYFASLQGDTAKRLLPAEYRQGLASIVYYQKTEEKEQIFLRSLALLAIGRRLGGIVAILAWLARLLPAFLTDLLYNLLARHRYRLFGKHESCPLPDKRDRHLFLD